MRCILTYCVDGYTERDIRFYKLLLEQGVLHHPKELLGFGFNGNIFLMAWLMFGGECARKTMNDNIAETFAQKGKKKNKPLFSSILKAATDDSIGLDGLYNARAKMIYGTRLLWHHR